LFWREGTLFIKVLEYLTGRLTMRSRSIFKPYSIGEKREGKGKGGREEGREGKGGRERREEGREEGRKGGREGEKDGMLWPDYSTGRAYLRHVSP
jgi:hypothetical protein